ncbi:MAG TPA: Tol-Pal system beta propeller repeat protein TolB [Dongiaceae bacterium]|nr:Tol-Pal system beta propeller repeat protein TolB [Dongiaceae bacterium]
MFVRYFAALFLLCAALGARAELTAIITKGIDNATPIAIVPLGWNQPSRLPEDVSAIVQADLHRSGQFKPLERGDMLSRPTEASQVFYRDWKALGSEWLVIGTMQPAGGGQYRADFEIFDVFAQRSAKKGTVTSNNLRGMAHYISDVIYETVTGIRGAFSTRMLYVTMEHMQARKQRYRLYVADVDGFNEKIILESPEPILSPTWAPNGRHIAYVSFQSTRPSIYIQDTVTGRQQKITGFPGLNGAPSFSPDGRQLAMTLSKDGNPEVYIMDVASGSLRRITNHYAIDTEATWARDGQSLIFTSERGGSPQIYRQHIATGKVDRLTFEGSYNARPALTPDGRFLAMVHRSNGVFHIAVQDLVKGSFTILTETDLDESPSIAPNASMILYATLKGNRGVLGAVSLDGRVKVQLPSRFGDVREPSWSPFL